MSYYSGSKGELVMFLVRELDYISQLQLYQSESWRFDNENSDERHIDFEILVICCSSVCSRSTIH